MSLSGQDIHKLDEASTVFNQHCIPILYGVYDAGVKSGFNHDQAFQLARDFMTTMLAVGLTQPRTKP